MAEAQRFLTPVGRLVQGDCFEPQTKDQQGNLRVVKSGPNAGQPNPQFFIAVAFRKDDPAFGELYGLMDRVARAGFPHLFPTPGQQCVNPQFAWKLIDGDGIDTNGKPNASKEGFASHWVIRFSSGFAPKVYYAGKYSDAERITKERAHEVKRGYFIRVAGSVAGNDNAQRPGLYLNFDMVELMAHGQEITSGPDAASTFAQAAPAQLPPGAVPIPMTAAHSAPPPPAAVAAPVPVPNVAPPVPAAVAPVPAAAPPVPAAAPPAPAAAPYAGYMAPPPTPGAAPAPAPVPAAAPPAPAAAPASPYAGLQLTAAAAGQTFDSLAQVGWTPELLLAQGMAVRV